MNRTARIVLPAALLLALAASGAALADELPSGDAVLDRYIEAIGGVDALEALTSRVTHGKLSAPAVGIEGTMETYSAPPNHMLAKTDLSGMLTAEEGCNGELVWENNSMTGPRLKEGEERDISLRRATFPDNHMREHYTSVENKGIEEVEGSSCYRLELTPKVGPVETWYVDTESGLIVRMDSTEKNPMGEIPATMTFGDYRKVDGILIAHSMVMKAGPMEMNVTIESIEHNVELPEGTFEPPEEVLALLEAPSGEEPPAPKTAGEKSE